MLRADASTQRYPLAPASSGSLALDVCCVIMVTTISFAHSSYHRAVQGRSLWCIPLEISARLLDPPHGEGFMVTT